MKQYLINLYLITHFHFPITSKIVASMSAETLANLSGLLRISFLTSNKVPTVGLANVKHALKNVDEIIIHTSQLKNLNLFFLYKVH